MFFVHKALYPKFGSKKGRWVYKEDALKEC